VVWLFERNGRSGANGVRLTYAQSDVRLTYAQSDVRLTYAQSDDCVASDDSIDGYDEFRGAAVSELAQVGDLPAGLAESVVNEI